MKTIIVFIVSFIIVVTAFFGTIATESMTGGFLLDNPVLRWRIVELNKSLMRYNMAEFRQSFSSEEKNRIDTTSAVGKELFKKAVETQETSSQEIKVLFDKIKNQRKQISDSDLADLCQRELEIVEDADHTLNSD